jgi:short-subunit dehydrogenase
MLERPLADHAILITGASSGIGAELARQLAAQGAWLVLTARRDHELDVVAQECIAAGGRAVYVVGDITDPHHAEHVVQRGVAAYGTLQVVINNAGVGGHFTVDAVTDLTVYDRIMRVNYLGAVYTTHFALPHLVASRGRLVSMSSLAGKTGVPCRAAYAASKHAMQGFFDSLRIELQGTGVSVTSVCPGFVQTPIRAAALGADGAPRGVSHIREQHAMSVEECAEDAIRAIVARKRELIMTTRGRMGAVLRPVLPALIDRIAANALRAGRT